MQNQGISMGGGSQGSGSQACAGAEKPIGITERAIVSAATVKSSRFCTLSSSARQGLAAQVFVGSGAKPCSGTLRPTVENARRHAPRYSSNGRPMMRAYALW